MSALTAVQKAEWVLIPRDDPLELMLHLGPTAFPTELRPAVDTREVRSDDVPELDGEVEGHL